MRVPGRSARSVLLLAVLVLVLPACQWSITGVALPPIGTAPPESLVSPAASDPAPVSATPSPTQTWATGQSGTVNARPFAMNLFRTGDFVAQYTFEWCVGASLQMALNVVTDEPHTTRRDQQRLWAMARDRSFSPYGGADPLGWTAALNDIGIGPYTLVSIPSYEEALALAAKAIRTTHRPVGLVMWAGRHAWVMTGFESTSDPRASDDFAVTGVRVLDPLYPYTSRVWGRSAAPNSLLTPRQLARQFVFRDGSHQDIGVSEGWVMVLPTKEPLALESSAGS